MARADRSPGLASHRPAPIGCAPQPRADKPPSRKPQLKARKRQSRPGQRVNAESRRSARALVEADRAGSRPLLPPTGFAPTAVTASVVRAARAHGPPGREADRGSRCRRRVRAPGRPGPGNATAGRPLWFSSLGRRRRLCPETTAPCPASRWVIQEITENAHTAAVISSPILAVFAVTAAGSGPRRGHVICSGVFAVAAVTAAGVMFWSTPDR